MGWWVFDLETEYEDEISLTSSSSSSSTRKNSGFWSEDEVESAYCEKQEIALPIRKGIREFYSGRSKSFACLDLSSGEEIGNPCNWRHKKVIEGGEVSKRPAPKNSECESVCSNSNSSCNTVNMHSRVSSYNLGCRRSRSCPNISQFGTLFI